MKKAMHIVAACALLCSLPAKATYYDAETGTFYNYHRDLDPSIGRYLESDPLGLYAGPLSTYVYVNNQPLTEIDPEGLEVQQCARPADLPFPLNHTDHWWLKTDTVEAGMGATPGEIPAQGGHWDVPLTPVQVVDHTGQSKAANASCKPVPHIDENCVNKELALGRQLGRFHPGNQCHSFVHQVIEKCTIHDASNPPVPPFQLWPTN